MKPAAPSESRSIVICDDNATLTLLLKSLFAKQGFKVWAAADGDEALALLRDENPDVLLLDLAMPARDGLSVLDALHGTAKRPYTFVLSAHQGEAKRAHASALGAHEVWRKPFDASKLLERVRTLARDGTI